ncbi:MAG: helix-turn-helix transcriptional regulator [Ignavibacteria bacterium]|nr:helix-turn-helix transcriptional regulator [Ignavibacteria bacterium]
MIITPSVHTIHSMPNVDSSAFDAAEYSEVFRRASVIVSATTTQIALPRHWTPLSIKCAFGGEETYVADNAVYAVSDTNFLIFNAEKLYSSFIQSPSPVESYTISFREEDEARALRAMTTSDYLLLNNPDSPESGRIRCIERLYEHDSLISPLLRSIRSSIKSPTPPEASAVHEQLCELLRRIILLQSAESRRMQTISAAKPSTRRELYTRLHRAKDFIHSCYAQPLRLEDAAQVACMCPHHFLRSFRSLFRQTPHQYLIARRIDVAKTLLQNTELPVQEICLSVGYDDESSFGKLFRKHTQLPPERFRRLAHNR